jgi:hypothetical protein
VLTRKPAPAQSGTIATPLFVDDKSGDAHRQLIGYIGLALPVVLIIIGDYRKPGGSQELEILG